jgi:L,D-transpeptidase ErfK/SrfK
MVTRLMIALAIALLVAPVTSAPARRLVGTQFEHVVVPGDSFALLGGRFGVDRGTIAARNNLRRDRPLMPGTALSIDARHIVPADRDVDLLVNVPQRLLFAFLGDGSVEAFPLGLGRRDWPTPLASFTVVAREIDPTWHVPPSIQEEMRRAGKRVVTTVPPSPENPLGKYWIGTSLPGIGIHGTNAPTSIYAFTTHGCIRVHPDRIRTLFDLTRIGAPGRIVYEPALLAEDNGRVFVEIHPDVYRRGASALETIRAAAAAADLVSFVDWAKVAVAIRERAGVAVDVTAATP